jgi:hypothetical protein
MFIYLIPVLKTEINDKSRSYLSDFVFQIKIDTSAKYVYLLLFNNSRRCNGSRFNLINILVNLR